MLALWAKAESQERTRSITEAIATLREALRIGQVLGSQVFVATVEISLALALNNWGKRREAVAICQEALERYTDRSRAAFSDLGPGLEPAGHAAL